MGSSGLTTTAHVDESARGWQVIYNRVRSRWNIPNIYLVVALVWGIMLVFLVPPFQNFDEAAHFYRVWSFAEGSWSLDTSGKAMLPKGVADLERLFPIVPLATGQAKMSPRDAAGQLSAPIGADKASSTSFSATYGPIGYAPQIVGALAVRLVGRSPLLSLYLGRLLSLVCAAVLTFFALRLVPYGKAALFLLALLPMTMLQMASLSPDALTVAGTLFFAALILHLTSRACLTTWDSIAVVVSGVLLLNAKPGYAVIALLAVALRPGQFRSALHYVITVGATVVGSLSLAVVLISTAPQSQVVLDLMLGRGNGVNAGRQISFVIRHPLSFLAAIKETLDTQGLFLAKLIVGAFAWGNLPITDTVALIAVAAFAAIICSRGSVRLEWWIRGLFLSVGALVALVTFAALYVGFSAVGAPSVNGLQGRYFVPSLALVILGTAGFPYGKRWLTPLVVGVLLLLLIASTINTLVQYYY